MKHMKNLDWVTRPTTEAGKLLDKVIKIQESKRLVKGQTFVIPRITGKPSETNKVTLDTLVTIRHWDLMVVDKIYPANRSTKELTVIRALETVCTKYVFYIDRIFPCVTI